MCVCHVRGETGISQREELMQMQAHEHTPCVPRHYTLAHDLSHVSDTRAVGNLHAKLAFAEAQSRDFRDLVRDAKTRERGRE